MKTIFCAKGLYIACGVLLCAIGILFLVCPDTMLRILCVILGAIMLLFAGAKIVGYLSKDPYGLAFQFDLAMGIFVAVLGIAFILHREPTVAAIASKVGLFVLIDAAFKAQTAIDAKKFGMRAWWLILVASLLAAATSIVLLFFQEEPARVLRILIGVVLIVDGAQNLYNTFYTVRVLRDLRKERFVSVLEDKK